MNGANEPVIVNGANEPSALTAVTDAIVRLIYFSYFELCKYVAKNFENMLKFNQIIPDLEKNNYLIINLTHDMSEFLRSVAFF